MTVGLVRCEDGSWESDGDKWKLFLCWICGTLYETWEVWEACKKSHPEDMPQEFMKPMGLDNYESVAKPCFDILIYGYDQGISLKTGFNNL